MYRIDRKDQVREITDIPQSSVGAPIPTVIAGEGFATVLFYAQAEEPGGDGPTVRVVGPDSAGKMTVIVRFTRCYAHMLGPPNDEAFSGHPLYQQGLRPYANFEVENSSWLRSLEAMNSVHPSHDRARFMDGKRHFILAFHDSTFECIAQSYIVETTQGSMREVVSRIGSQAID